MRHDGRRGHPRPRCLRREATHTTVFLAVPGRGRPLGSSLAAHQRWVARLLADLLPVLNLREVA